MREAGLIFILIIVSLGFARETNWQRKVDESFVYAYEKKFSRKEKDLISQLKEYVSFLDIEEKDPELDAVLRIMPVDPDSLKQCEKKGIFVVDSLELCEYTEKFNDGKLLEYHLPISINLSSLPEAAERNYVISIYKSRRFPLEMYEGFNLNYRVA